MGFLPLKSGLAAVLAVAALVFAHGTARAQSDDKKAEATPAATAGAGSGKAEPLPGESTYQQFKQDLFKPLETWKPGATQPILAIRPTVPPVSIKQAEANERERNWVFNGMNQLSEGSKPDDLRKLTDPGVARWGERGKTSVEKYYEDSGRSGASTNTLNDWINAWSRDPYGMNAMNPMNLLLPGSDQLIKKMLLPGDSPTETKKKVASSTSSAGGQEVSDEDLERNQRALYDLKRMMDPSLPPYQPKGFNPLLNPLAGMNVLSRPGTDFGSAPAIVPLPGTPTSGAMSPVLGVATTAGGGLPSMTSGPLKPMLPETVQKLLAEPQKPVLVKPMDPTATMPRRKF
jgi:hypothetical protein